MDLLQVKKVFGPYVTQANDAMILEHEPDCFGALVG